MSMTLLEQGTAHTGMLQTQGLTAFDSSRGVLLALLENGPFMRGHEVHLMLHHGMKRRH